MKSFKQWGVRQPFILVRRTVLPNFYLPELPLVLLSVNWVRQDKFIHQGTQVESKCIQKISFTNNKTRPFTNTTHIFISDKNTIGTRDLSIGTGKTKIPLSPRGPGSPRGHSSWDTGRRGPLARVPTSRLLGYPTRSSFSGGEGLRWVGWTCLETPILLSVSSGIDDQT